MALRSFKIQSIVFPVDDKHSQCRKLFYRGDKGILDGEKNELKLGYAQKIDLVTYINACSYRKWKTFTNCKKASINLSVSGPVRVAYVGYNNDSSFVQKKVFSEVNYCNPGQQEIEYEFPDNNEQMIGVEITALERCIIHGGSFCLKIDESEMQEVNLSLATTTFKKEDFIKKNVDLIKQHIINSNDEISKHFSLHVVDNGRTLSVNDINGKNVFLHPNCNSGGSGGFARGMYESIHQKKKATHVLLMDDDVVVLPESIKRTYCLLRLLKEEYRNSFISGAMLYFEDPIRQHEDVGTIISDADSCRFKPLKDVFNHENILDNLKNECILPKRGNMYSAWWYCCIPMHVIEKNGLPLPLFIRGDDCEYSLRCGANMITMNGICVWHMGFSTKYNAAFDLYQKYRNWLIMQSTSGVLQEINLMKCIQNAFRLELLRFNYDAAELIIRAVEDYSKGPNFIKNVDGEKNTNEVSKLNDKLTPLSELGYDSMPNVQSFFSYTPPTLKERVVAKLTWNGQRFYPECLSSNRTSVISFNEFFQLHGTVGKSRLLAINPFSASGIYRVKDKKRFKTLMRRFKKIKKYYIRNRDAITKEYSCAKKELTSENFWKKYLKIK